MYAEFYSPNLGLNTRVFLNGSTEDGCMYISSVCNVEIFNQGMKTEILGRNSDVSSATVQQVIFSICGNIDLCCSKTNAVCLANNSGIEVNFTIQTVSENFAQVSFSGKTTVYAGVPQRTVLLSPALSELIVYNGIPAPSLSFVMQDSFLNTVFHFSDTKDRSACIVSTTSVIQAVGTLCAPVVTDPDSGVRVATLDSWTLFGLTPSFPQLLGEITGVPVPATLSMVRLQTGNAVNGTLINGGPAFTESLYCDAFAGSVVFMPCSKDGFARNLTTFTLLPQDFVQNTIAESPLQFCPNGVLTGNGCLQLELSLYGTAVGTGEDIFLTFQGPPALPASGYQFEVDLDYIHQFAAPILMRITIFGDCATEQVVRVCQGKFFLKIFYIKFVNPGDVNCYGNLLSEKTCPSYEFMLSLPNTHTDSRSCPMSLPGNTPPVPVKEFREDMIGNSQDDQVDNVMRKFSETNPILLFRFQKPSPRNGFPPTLYDRPYYKRQWAIVRSPIFLGIYLPAMQGLSLMLMQFQSSSMDITLTMPFCNGVPDTRIDEMIVKYLVDSFNSTNGQNPKLICYHEEEIEPNSNIGYRSNRFCCNLQGVCSSQSSSNVIFIVLGMILLFVWLLAGSYLSVILLRKLSISGNALVELDGLRALTNSELKSRGRLMFIIMLCAPLVLLISILLLSLSLLPDIIVIVVLSMVSATTVLWYICSMWRWYYVFRRGVSPPSLLESLYKVSIFLLSFFTFGLITTFLAFLILALIISPTTALTPIVGVGSFIFIVVTTVSKLSTLMDIVEVSLRRAMFKIPSETELSDEEVEALFTPGRFDEQTCKVLRRYGMLEKSITKLRNYFLRFSQNRLRYILLNVAIVAFIMLLLFVFIILASVVLTSDGNFSNSLSSSAIVVISTAVLGKSSGPDEGGGLKGIFSKKETRNNMGGDDGAPPKKSFFSKQGELLNRARGIQVEKEMQNELLDNEDTNAGQSSTGNGIEMESIRLQSADSMSGNQRPRRPSQYLPSVTPPPPLPAASPAAEFTTTNPLGGTNGFASRGVGSVQNSPSSVSSVSSVAPLLPTSSRAESSRSAAALPSLASLYQRNGSGGTAGENTASSTEAGISSETSSMWGRRPGDRSR